MAEEPDGIDEAFDGMLRMGLTAAGRVAEIIARSREQAAREAQASSEQHARELAARLDAERSAARSQLAPVHRPDWWEQAKPQDVAHIWEIARSWEHVDPEAGRAVERIRTEVRDRFGVDVDAPNGDPGAVKEALERRGIAEEEADTQHERAGRDDAETARLLADAERADRDDDSRNLKHGEMLEAAGGDTYDTAERRRDLAASLEGVADSETVAARVAADTFQARPVREAVTHTTRKPPRATTSRPAASQRTKVPRQTLDR